VYLLVRENHPQHRRARKLARKKSLRAPYERILIVCEGHTERLYFEEIRKKYRLQTANIKVTNSDLGTNPRQVVEFALDSFQEDKEYDQIFTVFDRDEHRRYHEALDLIDSKKGKLKNSEKKSVNIAPIVSIPCFELWFLLHFEEINQLFHCSDIIKRLKKHLPQYDKTQGDHYKSTLNHIHEAITRSKRMCKDQTPKNDKQAYTNVYEVIEILHKCAKVE
jgi:hypothetical protein